MAEELRIVLMIIGVLAIASLVAHGLWSARKNSEKLQDYKQTPRSEPGINQGELDDHGVGKPRTVSANSVKKEPVILADSEPTAEINEPPFSAEPSAVKNAELDKTPQSVEPAAKDNQPEGEQVADPSEVLIIHVGMPDNQSISGAALLPQLIAMAFKYGEMDIFHRHQDSSGNGPILFSLANMYNPGTFDIDNMEQMSTRGISLFMTLPCKGEALQNFNMMHNAAKKLAEEFGGQILDSKRSAMTVQTVRHYVEKIREFERKQLLNG